MCLALPYKITSINGRQANVYCPACETATTAKSVSLELVPDLKIGDFILVQNNMAVRQVPKKEAAEILNLIDNTDSADNADIREYQRKSV